MTKTQFIRAVGFFLAVCCMLVILCDFFEQENYNNTDQAFYTYRNLNEDTIDGVFIGTSGVSCYWIPSQAYEDYGMTVYSLTADALPAWLYTEVIDEVLAHQNPELLILDIRAFTSGIRTQDVMDAQARRILDAMDLFSLTRTRAALKSMEVIHSVYEEAPRWDVSYFLSFAKYHTMWKDDHYRVSYHWESQKHPYLGFYLNPLFSINVSPIEPHLYDDTAEEDLVPLCEDALYDLLDYIREKDLNVLFIETPKRMSDTYMRRSNRIYRILEEEGFPYLTYLTTAADGSFSIDIDYERDFFNGSHTNVYGAKKFTRSLSAYLDEHYDLPDRRGDPAVQAQWEGKHQRFLEAVREMEEEAAGK